MYFLWHIEVFVLIHASHWFIIAGNNGIAVFVHMPMLALNGSDSCEEVLSVGVAV